MLLAIVPCVHMPMAVLHIHACERFHALLQGRQFIAKVFRRAIGVMIVAGAASHLLLCQTAAWQIRFFAADVITTLITVGAFIKRSLSRSGACSMWLVMANRGQHKLQMQLEPVKAAIVGFECRRCCGMSDEQINRLYSSCAKVQCSFTCARSMQVPLPRHLWAY